MRKIIRSRGYGKTWDLITISSKKKVPILVSTEAHKKHILSIAHYRCLDIPEPISINDYVNGKHHGRRIKSVLVDDAEMVLAMIFRDLHIDAISISID